MKKNFYKASVGLLVIGAAFAVTGTLTSCGRNPNGGKEKIDANKYQLYIHNFNGGYGSVWLDNYKKQYEDLHKNDEYIDASGAKKTGVQIIVEGDKNVISAEEIPTKKYDLYFCERAQYAYYKYLGYTLDVTDAVIKPNPYDNGKKIEDKLTESQKRYYGYDDNGDRKFEYYGIPHYSGTFGFTYNRDLFKSKGFYYKKGHPDVKTSPDYNNCFGRPNVQLEKGPDGQYGTDDDGLPETFDEFYFLCDYIANNGCKPLLWCGKNANDYSAALISCLTASLEGAEQYNLDYSFTGTKNNLVKINGDQIVKDGQGNIQTESVELTSSSGVSENGFEVTRALSRLNALSFLKKIVTTTKWHYEDNFNAAFENTMAQDKFIQGGRESTVTQTAMLIDGTWWANEASGTFQKMEETYGKNGSETALKRDFALMPFPKAKAEDEYHSTYLDILNSLQFAKKTTDATKKALVIDFLQYINSDAALVEFTTTTSVTRCLNYQLSAQDLEKMSVFGRSVYNLKNKDDTTIVYPFDRNVIYTNNQGDFEPCFYFKSILNETKEYPCETLRGSVSAEEYFLASYKFFKTRTYWGK